MNNNQNVIYVVVILGPTGVGKTKIALQLSQDYHGEIVSADSRQIYKDMDIGTGKEEGKKEETLKGNGWWRIGGINIYLYDIVQPDEAFSVSHFQKLALEKIRTLQNNGFLPLVVGGTGFYLKSLFEPIGTIGIKPDMALRKRLEEIYRTQGVQQLFTLLQSVNPQRGETIDPRNHRRIIRALEISHNHQIKIQPPGKFRLKPLFIGLTLERKQLYERVDQRIDAMVENGLINEIKGLLEKGFGWDLAAMSGIGYRQFKPFFENTAALADCIQRLKWDTHGFIRRQETWFRKQPGIIWFDVSDSTAFSKIRQTVQKFIAES